ncbi:hypothetical protein Tco_0182389, partial [Tanacetum coccineum]
MTGGPVVAPVTAGKPRGTTQEVTRGHLMIGMSDDRSEVLFIRCSECGRVHSRRVSMRNDIEAYVASCDWRIQLAYE